MNIDLRFKRLILSVMVFIGLTVMGTAATDVRCAIVQFTDHYPNEVPLDANRLAAQFRKAANHGAKIIVAPENCLYRIDPWVLSGVTQARLASYFDKMVAKFSALAAELNVCLVIGLREPSGLPRPTYQSAVFLGPDGSLLKTYHKRRIAISELGYTNPGGNDFTSFNTPYGKIWMQICKDMDGDYMSHMPTDIDLFIGISKDAYRGWSKVVNGCKKARCYGIGANWGTGGNSGFVNPSGNVVAATGRGETIIYATLPLNLPLDSYEPDNSASRAKPIGNGQTHSRSIHAAGDTDWVKFVVGGNGAKNVRIETAGPSGDTQMWLFKGSRQVAYNNDGGVGRFSRIWVSSLSPGTYHIKIREYGNNGTIPYHTLRAKWTTIYTGRQPVDLSIRNLRVVRPGTAALRRFNSCRFQIINRGEAIRSATVGVHFYLSRDKTFGNADDRKIGDTKIKGLSMSARSVKSLTLGWRRRRSMVRLWTQSLAPRGYYYLFARISPISARETRWSDNRTRTRSRFPYSSIARSAKALALEPLASGATAWARSGEGDWAVVPMLLDGTDSGWTGEPGAGPWAVALDFGEIIPLGDLGIDVAEDLGFNVGMLGTEDLIEWFDLESITNWPISCRAVFFDFRDDGTDEPPVIQEIRWEENPLQAP